MDRYVPVADFSSKEPLTFISKDEVQRWFDANGLFKNIDRDGEHARKTSMMIRGQTQLRVMFGLHQEQEVILSL